MTNPGIHVKRKLPGQNWDGLMTVIHRLWNTDSVRSNSAPDHSYRILGSSKWMRSFWSFWRLRNCTQDVSVSRTCWYLFSYLLKPDQFRSTQFLTLSWFSFFQWWTWTKSTKHKQCQTSASNVLYYLDWPICCPLGWWNNFSNHLSLLILKSLKTQPSWNHSPTRFSE